MVHGTANPDAAKLALEKIGVDVSTLIDAHNEAENNVRRGETAFLRVNLKSCIALAQRIERRARAAKKTLGPAGGDTR